MQSYIDEHRWGGKVAPLRCIVLTIMSVLQASTMEGVGNAVYEVLFAYRKKDVWY